jgi:type II secretory pathway pseudopilin PulG
MTQSPRSDRSAHTLTDVLIVISLITLFTSALLPAAERSRETSNRIRCASNLRQIGQAMMLYANENNGNFPRTKYDRKSNKLNAYTGFTAKDPFAKNSGPEVNDVTAPLYLLIRTEDIFPSAFVCPSSNASPLDFGIKVSQTASAPADTKRLPSSTPTSRPATMRAVTIEPLLPAVAAQIPLHSNFPDNKHLSYSLHNPYFSEKAIDNGARWTNTLRSEFAVAADMNPGGEGLTKLTARSTAKALRDGNSLNHGKDGNVVLFGDFHVEFMQTPFCGADQDNIYTYGQSGLDKGGDGVIGSSTGVTDSILLPTVDQGKASKSVGNSVDK